MRLLMTLADLALPPRESAALVRDGSYGSLAREVDPVCIGAAEQTCLSLFPYTRPLVEACIMESKFYANIHATELLAASLHEFLLEFIAESAQFAGTLPVLVPLPLSAARGKERGYNQVERVIRTALATAAIRAEIDTSLLMRTRETKPQTSLQGHERRLNVRGAFAVCRPCDPYRTYIVVDDVITTGNTMLAACEALRAGGAKHLLPLTFAY